MIKITNMKFVKQRGFYRFSYRRGDSVVTSAGFKNKEEFLEVLRQDFFFQKPEDNQDNGGK